MALATSTSPTCPLAAGEYDQANRHCVFRCGDSWFSVPAIAVREIVQAPELVHVPFADPSIVGLGRLRSEFVPVLALDALLNVDHSTPSSDVNCLLVFEGNSVWSLLISESAALESMETIVSQESYPENANNAVIGTAMYRDRIVRVLNPNGLLFTAQQSIERFWSRTQN